MSETTEATATANEPRAALQDAKAAAMEKLANQTALLEAPKVDLPPTPNKETTSEAPPTSVSELPSAKEPEAPEIDPTSDPRFQALLSKHREARQENERLKAAQLELEEKRKTIELAERIRKKDFRAIEDLGISFDDWADHELKKASGGVKEDPKPVDDYVSKLENRLNELETRIKTEKENELKQQQEAAAEQQLKDWKANLFKQIDEDPAFKALSRVGLHNKVYDKIVQYAADTQEMTGTAELLDYKKAARLVWEAEKKPFITWLKALSEVDEFKPFFGSAPAKVASEPILKTLLPGELGDAPIESSKTLSHEERKVLARQLLESQG